MSGSSGEHQAAAGKAPPKKVSQIGDFKLLKKLGQGGMGEVYLAKQVSLDRLVALKVLSKELAKRPGFVERFLREARSMARLDHPNAVHVYAAEQFHGLHFVAIEYVDGRSIQDWMEELGHLSVGDALHVVLRCADALRHALEMGIIHRDVKPENILVSKRGVVKLADFGLAKALEDEDMSLTQTGTGLGTPLYMAPEQARSAKTVDHRADIYALGVTLYYLLTGEHPFRAETLVELFQAKDSGRFKPARYHNREVPQKLDLILDKMLARRPEYRYDSYDELIGDLQSLRMDNPALSFIEGSSKPAPVVASNFKPRTTEPLPSTEAATVRQSEQPTRQPSVTAPTLPPEDQWFVKHVNAKGKLVISKMTTSQILRALKANLLNPKAQAKKPNDLNFQPLGQFAEFEAAVSAQVAALETQARTQSLHEIYRAIDRAERFRRRWGWLLSLVRGAISLLLFLAVLAALGYLAYAYGPRLIELLKERLAGG